MVVPNRNHCLSGLERKQKRRTMICCAVVWIVMFLQSFDVSNATWTPHQHPKGAHHLGRVDKIIFEKIGVNGPEDSKIETNSLRGGSTLLQSPPPIVSQELLDRGDHQSIPPKQGELSYQRDRTEKPPIFPRITLKQAAKALIHTSEWNRRLLQGIRHWGRQRNQILCSQNHYYAEQQHDKHKANAMKPTSRNVYGNVPVNVHPSRTWQPPIKGPSEHFFEDEDLSLFHAKKPRSQSISTTTNKNYDEESEAISYWGPELLPYLEHIVSLLGIENNDVEMSLAMIYMDRACSVETPRSNGVPSCPFCSPRTVHRLSLAALLVSIEAVRGETHNGEQFKRVSQSLGIPILQLQQMVEWMRGALGDDGFYVTLEQINRWGRTWESIFDCLI